jgi:hypothetical protein
MLNISMAQQGLAGRLLSAEALYAKEPGVGGMVAYPAALPLQKKTLLGVYGEKRFMSDLSFVNVMFSGLLGNQALLVSLSREGTNALSRSRISLSAGKKLGDGVQVGLNFGYSFYTAKGYTSSGEADAGIGALLPIGDRTRIGIQLNRLNALWGMKEFGFVARTGIGYGLSDVCAITLEATKEAGKPLLVDAGVYYAFHDHFYSRVGFCPSLSLISFNIGYRNGRLQTEMGQAIHLLLGSTWGMSLMYLFKGRE